MTRQKHSDKRLDDRLDDKAESGEPHGIFELFPRDEDAPLARDSEESDEK